MTFFFWFAHAACNGLSSSLKAIYMVHNRFADLACVNLNLQI